MEGHRTSKTHGPLSPMATLVRDAKLAGYAAASNLRCARVYSRLHRKHNYCTTKTMNASKKRKPGRPATGQIPARSIRLPKELSARIDSWAVKQPDTPLRSEAIRRLVELGLAKTKPLANATAVGRLRNKAVSKSSELAAKTIDRLSDQSASLEEQEKRKRRLLKGPTEFRDIRDLASDRRTRR
jgi:Arc/MetJ-type ribon-helix-helix transcriptional regulator